MQLNDIVGKHWSSTNEWEMHLNPNRLITPAIATKPKQIICTPDNVNITTARKFNLT